MFGFRRQKVKGLSKEKREKLSDNLLYAKFNRDVAEVKSSRYISGIYLTVSIDESTLNPLAAMLCNHFTFGKSL